MAKLGQKQVNEAVSCAAVSLRANAAERVQQTKHGVEFDLGEAAARQRWVIAIKTKIQLPNTLTIILNFVIGIIN